MEVDPVIATQVRGRFIGAGWFIESQVTHAYLCARIPSIGIELVEGVIWVRVEEPAPELVYHAFLFTGVLLLPQEVFVVLEAVHPELHERRRDLSPDH